MQPEPSHVSFYRRPVLIVTIIIVIALAGIASLVTFGTSHTSQSICSVLSTTNSAPGTANSSSSSLTAYFTIVESDPGSNYEGMNGSAFHLTGSWPQIQVYQGQMVVIQVFNCASSEPHGFAITHYFDSGATVRPGLTFTLKFVASQPGAFRVYCSIFCAIHPYMQNGELIVTPT